MIQTTTYVRKPLYVEAVQVTPENFNEIALWCQGDIQEITERGRTFQFIAVRVTNPMNPRQGQARVGDWILTSERGYKVYTPKAFEKAFDPATGTTGAVGVSGEVNIYQNGYTPADLQELLAKGHNVVAVSDEPIEATRDSRVENNAVGTGPMPEQPLPGDTEVPTTPPAVPENLTERDPNVVYPDSPETTA